MNSNAYDIQTKYDKFDNRTTVTLVQNQGIVGKSALMGLKVTNNNIWTGGSSLYVLLLSSFNGTTPPTKEYFFVDFTAMSDRWRFLDIDNNTIIFLVNDTLRYEFEAKYRGRVRPGGVTESFSVMISTEDYVKIFKSTKVEIQISGRIESSLPLDMLVGFEKFHNYFNIQK
jgi:hypothetical protein